MKDTYYFRHDYNSRNDLKMQALLEDHGAIGYGLFWAIIEILHEEETHSLPLSAMIYKAIGKQMSTSVEQVEQVVKSCLSYGLFIQDENKFYSERVNENIETRDEISALRSKAGKESAKRRANLTPVEQVPTSDEQNPTKKSKEKEIKEKESRVNESIEEREKEFKKQVFSFNQKYSDQMLLAFFNYWSEKSKSGKMRWEMEKTYEISKRLVTWQGREKQEPVKETYRDVLYYTPQG